MTREEFKSILAKPGIARINPELSNPHFDSGEASKLEPDSCDEPLAKASLQDSDKNRFLVRVVAVRTRLLDEDNGCEKFLVDQLRSVGAIPDDRPEFCKIETSQRLCEEGEPEHVEIIVETI